MDRAQQHVCATVRRAGEPPSPRKSQNDSKAESIDSPNGQQTTTHHSLLSASTPRWALSQLSSLTFTSLAFDDDHDPPSDAPPHPDSSLTMTDAKQKPPQQQPPPVADSAEVYPYSVNDAIRPNAPLPASLSHPQSNVTTFTNPTGHSNASQLPATDLSLTSTSALLQTLVELSIDVKRMCVEDANKTAGTSELAQRMDELRAVLAEHTDLIFAHCSSTHLHTALLSLRTTLLSAHLILHKAVNTAFRRSHKFKQPIRITINDTLIGLSKLTSAISLAVATSSSAASAAFAASLPSVQLLDGQEESVLGDKYYYGHGLPVDYVKALHLYTIAADKGYSPAHGEPGLHDARGSGTQEGHAGSAVVVQESGGERQRGCV